MRCARFTGRLSWINPLNEAYSMKKNVRELYNNLAATYDDRWEEYIARSVAGTVQRVGARPYRTVLDVGCGTGAVLAALSKLVPDALLVGVDVSQQMLVQARVKLGVKSQLIGGQAECLPFASGSFDLVISNSSFHYWEQPQQGLHEIRRLLKVNGQLVLTDWCDDYVACKLCDQFLRLVDAGHQRCFGTRACEHFLMDAAYTEIKVEKYKINWLWGLMTATAKNSISPAAVFQPKPNGTFAPLT